MTRRLKSLRSGPDQILRSGPDQTPSGFGSSLRSRYLLERVIGHGPAGTVWVSWDEVLQRRVAVKLPAAKLSANPSYLSRFTTEARAAAGLWHPNLVQIFDFGLSNGQPFLVMEYLSGGSLGQHFQRQAVTSDELRRLACDLLSGLAFLHRQDLVHGSVSPERVLLDEAGRPHLSRLQGTGAARDSAALPGDDLFALGELLAEAPCRPDRDPALANVIGGLLAPESGRRLGTAEAALEALTVRSDPAGQETQEFDVFAMLAEEPEPR